MELTERTANGGGGGGSVEIDNSSSPTSSPYSNGSSSINSKRNTHYKNAHDSDDDDTSDMEKLLKGDSGDDDENGGDIELTGGKDQHDHETYDLSQLNDRPWNLHDWLYPPHIPRSCQLLRRENIAIPACYLLVGLLQGLLGPLCNVYPMDLGATEAQYTTISSIKSLPASFKLAFGFLSDNVPVLGYRRKSYMLFGWLLASCSMCTLLLGSNLTLSKQEVPIEDDSDGDRRYLIPASSFSSSNSTTTTIPTTKIITVAPDDAPSIPFLSLMILLFGIGFWMADVMGDSVVAEKAKLEPIHSRGSIQSSCYAYRFFGLMVAAPCSTAIYHYWGPYYVFFLLSLLPLCILPLIYQLGEVQYAPVASTKDQCLEIWNTVCSRCVWQPLGFVFVYNILQVQNGAWKEFLKTTLGFTTSDLNLIYVVACVLLYSGIMCYKYYMIKWSWRFVYIWTTILNGFFSLLQVLLLMGITLGLGNFWFALGDDAMAEFIQGIQFLPTTIMMVHLCPSGSEGASYAMFTTVNNSAGTLSVALTTWMLSFWDVSKKALAKHELSGMIKLTYFTTALQVSGVFLVGLLPETKEHLFDLKNKANGTSSIGGFIFLSVTFCSIAYAITVGVLNIVAPGWMGES